MEFLFEKWNLAGRSVKNRLSTLPMEGNDAEANGAPSRRTVDRYRKFAASEWGIVYVEAIAPGESGKARPGQLVLTDETLDSFKKMTDEIRAASQEPPIIIFQINHAGRYGINPLIAYRNDVLDPTWTIPEGLEPADRRELEAASQQCADAVLLTKKAGADGADLKCCHGYLAIELARPGNRREDIYGGSFANRTRFLRAMAEAAESVADKDFFFGSRLSIMEGIPGGLGTDREDSSRFNPDVDVDSVIELLQSFGAAFICETAGIPYLNPEIVRPHSSFADKEKTLTLHHELSEWIKRRAPEVAVIGAGFSLMEMGFVEKTGAMMRDRMLDAAGLGRQSFADPETPLKLMNGDEKHINWCKGCRTNNCSFLLRSRALVGCPIYDIFYKNILRETKNQQAR